MMLIQGVAVFVVCCELLVVEVAAGTETTMAVGCVAAHHAATAERIAINMSARLTHKFLLLCFLCQSSRCCIIFMSRCSFGVSPGIHGVNSWDSFVQFRSVSITERAARDIISYSSNQARAVCSAGRDVLRVQ